VIRLVVRIYLRSPLSLRNVEDLLFERGIDLSHETIRFSWNRFGPLRAGDIRRQRAGAIGGLRHWRCDVTPVFSSSWS
jgi:putative transposase